MKLFWVQPSAKSATKFFTYSFSLQTFLLVFLLLSSSVGLLAGKDPFRKIDEWFEVKNVSRAGRLSEDTAGKRLMVILDEDGFINVWDVIQKKSILSLKVSARGFVDAAFIPNTDNIIVLTGDKVRVYSISKNRYIASFKADGQSLFEQSRGGFCRLSVSHDGSYCAILDGMGSIYIWKIRSAQLEASVDRVVFGNGTLRFTSDDNGILICGRRGSLAIIDRGGKKILGLNSISSMNFYYADCTAAKNIIVAAALSETIVVSVSEGSVTQRKISLGGGRVGILASGDHALIGTWTGGVIVNLSSGEYVYEFPREACSDILLSQSKLRVYRLDRSGKISVWEQQRKLGDFSIVQLPEFWIFAFATTGLFLLALRKFLHWHYKGQVAIKVPATKK